MYKVLDKDIIENEIIPHLSVARRGFKTKSCLIETVNSILYKLKTGIQWEFLPVHSLFSKVVPSYKTVFGHFRKWCKNGDWHDSWIQILSGHKADLDMSSADIDGSHTPALKGREEVAYRGRKRKKTTNSLYLTDRQGLPLAVSNPVAGNHHDLYNIEDLPDELFQTLTRANIKLDGLFINADAGFDSKEFRETCLKNGIFANVDFNSRNGDINGDKLLDELLYKERYSIERTNVWLDSFRTLLNRFDTSVSSWKAFNYIAFMVILLKKTGKNKKSR
jgi:transposase